MLSFFTRRVSSN